MESIIERCATIIEDLRYSTVRQWKKNAGGKVAGYFPVYAPVELIHACGMLPVQISGAGDRLDIQHADARFGSFICSIIKTTLEMGLTGHLDFLDGLLFSSICDSARNLCFVMKRNFPNIYVDFVHLPHNPSSHAAAAFLAEEYRRILAELEKLAGRTASDEQILSSIRLYNRSRELIRKLYDLRKRQPELLSATECYVLVRAGNLLPVEEHIELMQDALSELPQRNNKRRDSLRIVVEGSFCEQPPLGLIRLIEEAGCYIVDDDFALGQSWFDSDVSTHGDPVSSLARSYLDTAVYSSVRHDFRKPRWHGLLEKVKQSRADAVLFLIAKFCEPGYFDYVPFKQELEKHGIPHLLLEFEEKLFTFDRVRTEIETFVESLVFD